MTAIPMPLPFQPPAKARSPFTAVTTWSRAPATGRSGEMYATPEWEARLLRLPPLTLTNCAWIQGQVAFCGGAIGRQVCRVILELDDNVHGSFGVHSL